MNAQVYVANRIVSGRIHDAQEAVQVRDALRARRSERARRARGAR